jgi:hypothetical protein
MKKLFILTTFIGLLLLTACSDSDSGIADDNTPQIQLTASTIHTKQGREILIEGEVSDPIGIASVNLKNDLWYLNKTITVRQDTLQTTYQLSYKFLIPDTASDVDQTFAITVTNVGGKTFSANLVVAMDGDFVSPTISFAGLVSDGAVLVPGPTDSFDINFTIADDRRLGYLVIKETSLGLNDSIASIAGKEYKYVNSSIAIPQKKATYSFELTYADSAGNTVTQTLAVQVNVSWDFEKLYLADVSTNAEFTSDLFGVPVLMDKTASYTYEAKYFAEAANTEIRFVAQKSGFAPNCFGIDPDNTSVLKNSSTSSLPIVLPSIGYYKITISTNPDILSYTVESIDPMTDANRPALYVVSNTQANLDNYTYVGVLGLIGSGFADCPNMNWSPAQIANYSDLQLKQDATYPYRWTTTVALNGNVQFIIGPEHPWNWWPNPFWRFNDGANPEYTIFEGGTNVNMTVSSKTTYKFIFDMYLNRARMIQQ